MSNDPFGAIGDALDSTRAIVGIVITLVAGAIILDALYNASVQTTGKNSVATQTIGQELSFWSIFT